MKELMIKPNREPAQHAIAFVDDEDYDRLSKFKWHLNDGRPARSLSWGGTVYMSQDVLGKKEGCEIDHINRNKLDNQKTNLRHCTHAQNGKNRSNNTGRSTKGVSFHTTKEVWQAYIRVDYKLIHLGYFNTQEEAKAAYQIAAIEHFGEFAS